ncbi:hypothetical protein D3C76_942070 [compost metagenome]
MNCHFCKFIHFINGKLLLNRLALRGGKAQVKGIIFCQRGWQGIHFPGFDCFIITDHHFVLAHTKHAIVIRSGLNKVLIRGAFAGGS